MSKREALLALCLAVAAVLVVVGVSTLSTAMGWVIGGVLLAVWAWLVLGDIG